MEIPLNLVILVLGTLVTIAGGSIGVKLVSNRHMTPDYIQDKMTNLKEDYNDLKKENHYLRGKVSQVRQKFKVDDDYDLDNDNDLVSLAKSVLPSISEFLPKDVQKHVTTFLSNPDVVELISEVYKKHPKEIKQLMGGFLKKGSGTSSSDQGELETKALQEAGGA